MTLLFTKLGHYKKAVKDLVISSIALQHPQRLVQIHDAIKRQHAIGVTYQAVRKACQELVSLGILIRSEKGYEISKNWVKEAVEFVDTLRHSYLDQWKPMQKTDVGENVEIYTVNSIYEAEKLWGELLFDWVRKEATLKSWNTFQTTHIWTLFFHLEWEERQIIELNKTTKNKFTIIYSSTFLDKVAQKFYNQHIPTKNVIDPTWIRGCSIGTYDDLILQVYQPSNIAKEIDKFYQGVKKLEDVNLTKMSEIAKKPLEVKVTVMRNPQFANQIRQNVLKHFP